MTTPDRNVLPRIVMGAVAIAIPAIVVGRVVVGIALALALIAVPLLEHHQTVWRTAKPVFASRTALLIALVAVAWLPSMLASSDPLRSLEAHVRTFAFIAAGVIVWAAMRVEKAHAGTAFRVLLVTSAVLCGLGLIGLTISDEFLQVIRGHGWIDYPARRALKESASSAAILLPLVIFAGYRLRGPWLAVAIVVVVELLLLIFFTANRSALAGLLAGTVVVVGLVAVGGRERRLQNVTVVTAAVLLVFVGWGLQRYHYPTAHYPQQQMTPIPYWLVDPPRQAIWVNAWNLGSPYRVFGAGINVIDRLPGAHQWNETTNTRVVPLHPHNWVVEIAVETGLVGLAAMLVALAYISWRLICAYLQSRDYAVLSAVYVWAAYWAIGLFSVSYWSSWWQVSFVAAMALSLAMRFDGDASTRPPAVP